MTNKTPSVVRKNRDSTKSETHKFVFIIESVDFICRDSADTQQLCANTNKFLKISKTANL